MKARRAPKCPQISLLSANSLGFSLLAKTVHYKYRKNRKNNRCNKIQDLEEVEGKNGPEMSANIANIARVTTILLASKYRSLQISQKSQE